MGAKIEPNGDFIDQWISARQKEEELDPRVLQLIETCRNGATLDESGLLRRLLTLAAETEIGDGFD